MSSAQALETILSALQVAIFVVGPVLAVSLVAGLLVGVAQTVLQINEASVSFVVKVAATVGVLVVLGPMLATKIVDYTRQSLESIASVVH